MNHSKVLSKIDNAIAHSNSVFNLKEALREARSALVDLMDALDRAEAEVQDAYEEMELREFES